MALVLKNCVPCWAQQYSDIPCNVVGLPFLSTILFPLTLSLPCFCTKFSSARKDEDQPEAGTRQGSDSGSTEWRRIARTEVVNGLHLFLRSFPG